VEGHFCRKKEKTMTFLKIALLLAIMLALVCLAGAAVAAPGTTIYVSTAGSDTGGNGSLANPFRTIGHALTIAASGDEIVLRGAPALTNNIYAESIRIQQPNITIRSQTGEWAIIQCPVNNANIGQCVRFDVDSDGSRLQRVEVIGGYYYGIKLETKWDWGGPDRSGASHILLEEVKVHDTGRDAIKITPGCDDVIIRRAEIFNTGIRDNSNAEGIDNVNGDRMIVQDSYLHDTATNGIYFKGGSTDTLIERNRIERTGGAGILVGFDTSPEFFDLTVNPHYYESIRGVVRNNIIRNTQGAGIGLYAAKEAQIWNNTLINTAQAYHSPIYFGVTYQDWDPHAGRPPSVNPILRNNLVYQSSNLPTECVFIRYSNDLGGLSALTGMPAMDDNLYFHAGSNCRFTDRRPASPLDHGTFSQWQSHISGESHSLTGAPQLTTDGHLQAGSPAVDAGVCTGAPSDDFDGDRRPQGAACDIGADEFTSSQRQLLFYSAADTDGWIREATETANQGKTVNSSAATLRLGDNAANRQYRSILSFDTQSLPDNAVLTKVTLQVRQQGVTGAGDPVSLFQGFILDVRKGTFGAPALEATDWQAVADRSYGPFIPSLSGGWYTFDLTGAGAFINKEAINGGLTQIRLRFQLDDNNNAVADYLSLYSGNAAAARRPRLLIEYQVP
jgi:hypothetical protein